MTAAKLTTILLIAGCVVIICTLLTDAGPSIRRIIALIRDNCPDSRRWLDTPTGCCLCGTGGPYYEGDAAQVVRYLYAGAMAGGRPDVYDWSSCSRHPLDGLTPVVDYGQDVVKTFRETEADAAAAGFGR